MASCPNINAPEFKAIEAIHGRERATLSFHMNNEVIPTVEEAAVLLGIPLAPNGQPSKLYQDILSLPEIAGDKNKAIQLYQQVQSPAFKKWFGDSKVVDDNGEPLIVYHGTNKQFDKFEGFSFFAKSRNYAEGYGKLKTDEEIQYKNLNKINSLSKIQDLGDFFKKNRYLVTNEQKGNKGDLRFDTFEEAVKARKEVVDSILGKGEFEKLSAEKGNSSIVYPAFLRIENPNIKTNIYGYFESSEELIENGYDGLMGTDARDEEKYGKEEVFATISSNQIKSVFNQGEFSTDTANIYYQLGTSEVEQANRELDQFLLNYLKPYGVKVKDIEELKKKFDLKDALGVADVLNKVIYLSKNNRKIDTMAEETAHIITM